MASIQKFSDHVIDYAERLANMADAAEGKRKRGAGSGARWLILPAAGAGLFALVKSEFMSRQAKGVVEEAKTRASDLPDDLLGHVRQASQKSNRTGTQRSRQTSSTSSSRRSGSARSGRTARAPTRSSARTKSSR
jgi:hypothetical protein